MRYANANTAARVNNARASCFEVLTSMSQNCRGFRPTTNEAKIAANKQDVPAPESQGNL